MSQVTYEDEVILDSTGQEIVSKLDDIKEAIENNPGGGGTTVVANPTGTATGGNLNKLQVGADIYAIPQTDISGKADKVANATNGNFAALDSNGDLVDSGNKASDFLTQHQDVSDRYSINDTAETAIDDADYIPFYDSSATAKRKSLWSNIKSVLKTYFDTLYNKITVAVSKKGTASSSAFRKQVITIDNVDTEIDGSAYMEQQVTLSTSAATTVTFTNAAITDGAMLTLATSLWDLVPDAITLASGSCVITLPKWATAETIGVRLYVR